MLTLSKKTDYALISLAYLAGREGGLASARQIASAADLPLALLMQILKTLHQHGILRSTRGVKGGYCLAPGAEAISLLTVIRIVDGNPEPAACGFASHGRPQARRDQLGSNGDLTSERHPPLVAMHRKLLQFLEQVKVFDVIRPGRRIDVPVEAVRCLSTKEHERHEEFKEELLTTGSAGLI